MDLYQCIVSSDFSCIVEIIPGKICNSTDSECNRRKDAVGPGWDMKKIFFMWSHLYIAQAHWRFGQNHWNTLCWVTNFQLLNLKIFVNNEIVRDTQYPTHYYPLNEIFFMNTKDLNHSFHGAITDVQMWNRALTHSQLIEWAQCQDGDPGDLINWETADFNVTGLIKEVVDKEEICQSKANNNILAAFNRKSSFSDSVQFCSNFGEVASVLKEDERDEMIEAVRGLSSPVCNREVMPAGMVHSEAKQAWIDFNTGTEVAVDNWYPNRPSNDTETNNCLFLITYSKQFYDLTCGAGYAETCPVCRMSKV